jgi:PAS domain S-box-containing protein
MNEQSKLTEEQKELTYRAIFKDSCEPKFIIDRKGYILDANSSFCERIGKKPSDCISLNIFSIFPSDISSRRKHYADEVFRTGKRLYFEENSDEHYFRISIYPIFGDSDKAVMLYILVQDITEIKKVESKNKKHAAFNREAMEAFPGPFTVLDSTGKIVSCNSYFRKLIAKNEDDDLSGINTFDLFHPDDIAPLNDKLLNIIENGAEETADLRVLMHGGPDFRWFRLSTKRIIIDKELFLVSSGIDIEKDKNTEKRLSLSNEQLRFILSESKTGSWEWDINSNTNTWSDEIWELYGLEKYSCEPSFKDWLNTIIEEDKNKTKKTVIESSKKGVPFRIEWRIKNFDNSLHWLMAQGTPFKDASGNVSRYVGIVIDITDLKEAEQKLRESEERFIKLFEDHASPIIIIDSETNRIISVNDAATKFYGWPSQVMCSMSLKDISTTSPEALLKKNHAILNSENTSFFAIHRMADGSHREVELFCNLSNLSDKRVYFCIINDVTERNKSEKEAQKRQSILDAALKSMSDAVVITDREGSPLEVNNAFLSFHRFSSREACLKTLAEQQNLAEYKNLFELTLPDGTPVPPDQWPVQRALHGESGTSFHYGLKRNNTEERRNCIFSFAPVRDQEGKIIGSVVSVRDITHIKKAEEALRESEERFRNFFEQHSAVMMIINPETGNLVDVNNAAAEYYGWSKEQLLRMTVMELNVEPHDASFKRLEGWNIAEKRTFTVSHRKADGTVCDLEVFGRKIKSNNRHLAFLILHDITERKQFQQALVESNERIHFILNAANAGTWETSLETNESKWSEEIWPLFCIEPGSCSPSLENWLNNILPEDRVSVEQAVAESIQSQVEFNSTWRIRDTDGNIKWLLCKGNPIKNADGKVVKYVGITLDITEQKRIEEEKMMLESRIRRSERLETLGNLSGGIAHDFNNILTPILGYAEMGMLSVPEKEQSYNFFRQITTAAERAQNLVYQILMFSKARETESSNVAVQSVIEEALKLLRASIPSTIRIEKHINQSCRNIFADPSKIYQVILNLCTNAFQAMEDTGGTLTIELDEMIPGNNLKMKFPEIEEKTYVLLTIADTGHGMNSKTLDRIFEPFFTTKAVNKGTGLGLSVVHGIITSYKGVIDVESEPEKGTTFTIYLPVSDKEITCKEQKKRIPNGTANILLVDDEKPTLEVMSIILTQSGHKVQKAYSPGEALELFRKSPQAFDLVVTDLTMPEMTGIRLASEIYTCRPELPVILMTGYEKNMEDAGKSNIVRLLKKPIRFDTIVSAISEAIEGISTL